MLYLLCSAGLYAFLRVSRVLVHLLHLLGQLVFAVPEIIVLSLDVAHLCLEGPDLVLFHLLQLLGELDTGSVGLDGQLLNSSLVHHEGQQRERQETQNHQTSHRQRTSKRMLRGRGFDCKIVNRLSLYFSFSFALSLSLCIFLSLSLAVFFYLSL